MPNMLIYTNINLKGRVSVVLSNLMPLRPAPLNLYLYFAWLLVCNQ